MATEADTTSSTAISNFVSEYRMTKQFYSLSADFAHEHCESLLQRNAIRAIVSNRTKQVNRLETKLRERVTKLKKTYNGRDSILADIVDLVGVRIALYFPNDAEKIAGIITEAFDLVERRSYPEPQNPADQNSTAQAFKPRFSGYVADHYRVRIRRQDLNTAKLKEAFEGIKPMPMIEIQVASVLMHAWAEVNHDLVYKTLTGGAASDEELRILDAANGMVQSGEVLLQQLQLAVETRVTSQKEPFQDQYELSSFLRKKYQLKQSSTDQFFIPFQILKEPGLDSPMALTEKLEGWHPVEPIALSLLDHVIADHREDEHLQPTNSLLMKRRPLSIDEWLEEGIDLSEETLIVPMERADAMYQQSKILDRAVSVADAILYPHKSLLDLSTVVARKFQLMHADIIGHRHQFRACSPHTLPTRMDNAFIIPRKLLDAVIQMWAWFEDNEDVLFRVSLKLARLPVEDVIGTLTAPSMSAQRDDLDPMLPRDPRSPISPPPSSGKSSPFPSIGTKSSPSSPQPKRPVYTGSPPVYKGYSNSQAAQTGPEHFVVVEKKVERQKTKNAPSRRSRSSPIRSWEEFEEEFEPPEADV